MNSNLESINRKSTYTFTQPSTNDIFTSFSNYKISVIKVGNIVTLYANVIGVMEASNDFETLLNLPEEYCPTKELVNSYCTQYGDPMCIYITTDGSVQLYNNNKKVNAYLRQIISWVV